MGHSFKVWFFYLKIQITIGQIFDKNADIFYVEKNTIIFTAALALRSRGLVIGSREEKEEKEREREEEEKNLQIAIRCLWDLFD